MAICLRYLAAGKGKITSDHCLHTNGPSLPSQIVLFTEDIGKEPLAQPVAIHLEAWAACTPGVDSKHLGLSVFQAMRTAKK